jgi:hypothetical protein
MNTIKTLDFVSFKVIDLKTSGPYIMGNIMPGDPSQP